MTKKNLIKNEPEIFHEKIVKIIQDAKNKVFISANTLMVHAYWNIGKTIVEEEQSGKERAEYGKKIVESLAQKLKLLGEKGFDRSNLWMMRHFYLTYPILDAVRQELTWTHYRLLLRVDDEKKRCFYEIECIKSIWSTRELERQINTLLYERLALSRDKKGLLSLSQSGADPAKPSDIVKDPFVLEFLGLSDHKHLLEKDLEDALLTHLQSFLLELGRGFSFVARQKRITLGTDHFYLDLVFYHYLLKCFVIIDLKMEKLTHQDIGQMQMYVNYYEKELTPKGDNPPVGIILCSDKNDAIVKYTLNDENKKIFASKYKLQLPTEDELKKELIREKEMIILEKKLSEEEIK
jgi:predicted nuclease of restriction endonuclease-like (RecB) superfamily